MTRGVTLVELLVALTILGMMLGLSGVALASLQLPRESAGVRELERARATAIRTGRPTADTNRRVLFLPDGRALGAGADPLTGAPYATR